MMIKMKEKKCERGFCKHLGRCDVERGIEIGRKRERKINEGKNNNVKHQATIRIRYPEKEKPRIGNIEFLCTCGKYHKVDS